MPPERVSVLHLIASDQRRGAESFALLLDERLALLGWRSEVRTLRGSADQGLAVEQVGDGGMWLSSLREVRRLASSFDLVVAHGSRTLPVCALALRGAGIPFVYANIGDPTYWVSTPARRARVVAALATASAVVAISPQSVAKLHDDLAVPYRKLRCIPNGRSGTRFHPLSLDECASVRTALGLPLDRRVAVTLGALAEEKRVDVAIDGIAATDWHLAVAGVGPLREQLERQAGAVAPGRVHFLGRTDEADRLLGAADAILLTSDSEGVPGVLIEAGLAGVPAVTTDVGFVRDVVRDGETGLVVPVGSPAAVAAALMTLESAPGLGAAARAHCLATFELDSVLHRWVQLLEDVATAPRRARAPLDVGLRRSPLQPWARRRARSRLRVLAYHGVDDQVEFEGHLDRLLDRTIVVSLDDVLAAATRGAPLPPDATLITFDDGECSVLERGLPALQARGLPSVAFVIAGLVGSTEPFWWVEVAERIAAGATSRRLGKRSATDAVRALKQVPQQERLEVIGELRESSPGTAVVQPQLSAVDLLTMERGGMAVENHSMTHPLLDQCTDADLDVEVYEAADVLADHLGRRPRAFAYPNGNSDPRVVRAVQGSGHHVGFAFDHRLQALPVDQPMVMSRVRVNSTTPADRFETILSGLHPAVHHLRGRA